MTLRKKITAAMVNKSVAAGPGRKRILFRGEPKNFRDALRMFDTNEDAAQWLLVSATAIKFMIQRNDMRPLYWPRLVDALRSLSVSVSLETVGSWSSRHTAPYVQTEAVSVQRWMDLYIQREKIARWLRRSGAEEEWIDEAADAALDEMIRSEGSPQAYGRTVAWRYILDARHKHRKISFDGPVGDGLHLKLRTEADQETRVFARQVLDASTHLPEKYRRAFRLMADGADNEEIARKLEIECESVRWVRRHTRRLLAHIIGETQEDARHD